MPMPSLFLRDSPKSNHHPEQNDISMPNDDPGNIFDDDDALDIIFSEDVEDARQKRPGNTNGRGGCLGVSVILVVCAWTGLMILSGC